MLTDFKHVQAAAIEPLLLLTRNMEQKNVDMPQIISWMKNPMKNRSERYVCWERTRVILNDHIQSNDYINAK